MCVQNPTLLLLCLSWIPTGLRRADHLSPLQLSSCLRATSSVSLAGSWRWCRLSLGHLFSLKDLGGWRVRWWKGLGGVFPVPVRRARPEWITGDAGRFQYPSVTCNCEGASCEKKESNAWLLIKNLCNVLFNMCCKHCPKRLYCTRLHP